MSGDSCSSCSRSDCPSKERRPGEDDAQFQARRELAQRMCRIPWKIVVLSGKGGVGKSTVATNLAVALQRSGHQVGLLDVDVPGPSVPKLLGIEGKAVGLENGVMAPVTADDGLRVMSIGFLLRDPDDAVIWRGPMKMGVIQQFLKDVEWGDCEWLIIDSPPGTGDEPLSICQLLPDLTGAVIVTTPQEVALVDVRKSVSFCRKLDLRIIGIVENMSGFVCPHCGEITYILKRGGGECLATDMDIPFLGRIPLDPTVAEASDAGTPFAAERAAYPAAAAFAGIVDRVAAVAQDPPETN